MNDVQRGNYSVLCVDDNPHVANALRIVFTRRRRFQWVGWLPQATELIQTLRTQRPTILLMDLDMPGRDPLEALAEVESACPGTKTVVFSGHVNKDLITRAIDAGAWGYVSKNEGEQMLLETVEKVLLGEFTLSPLVRTSLES